MTKHEYRIVFENDDICLVWAFNALDAKILAQAEQIKRDRNHTVFSITVIR